MKQVSLMVRDNCPKCKEALEILEDLREKRDDFRFDVRDVDEDEELYRKYTDFVPVVLVDGEVEFRLFLDRDEFQEVLDRS
ncbi:MAG: glutaredoxin family protein [Halobacteria archaeon]